MFPHCSLAGWTHPVVPSHQIYPFPTTYTALLSPPKTWLLLWLYSYRHTSLHASFSTTFLPSFIVCNILALKNMSLPWRPFSTHPPAFQWYWEPGFCLDAASDVQSLWFKITLCALSHFPCHTIGAFCKHQLNCMLLLLCSHQSIPTKRLPCPGSIYCTVCNGLIATCTPVSLSSSWI